VADAEEVPSKKFDNAKAAASMTIEDARAFKIPFGDFKGQILGDVYTKNAAKLQESAKWAKGANKFPDMVKAVTLMFTDERDAAA
jgi:hypothetical protein